MEPKKIKKSKHGTFQGTDPVLKKHVGLIHCENKLTLIQRKICNILLFNALDKINEDEIHEISLKKLCSLVGYNSHDSDLIKRSLKILISIVIEWNLLDDHKFVDEKDMPDAVISWHASSLLAGASLKSGLIRYSYSPQIKVVLSSLEIYGRINLFVQAKFNSSYSLVLYENCVRFKNISQTSWFSLKLFRTLMGVGSDKYVLFKELKRNVIAPAVAEINLKADIHIDAEYRKEGKQIKAIRFLISENPNYKPLFRRVIKPSAEKGSFQNEFRLVKNQEKNMADKRGEKTCNKIILNREGSTYGQPLMPMLTNDQNGNKNFSPETSVPNLLRKKYMEYKFKFYFKCVDALERKGQSTVVDEFKSELKTNGITAVMFNKKGFSSPFVMFEFIHFIERHYYATVASCLSFEDFITAEEDAVSI